MTGRLPLRVIAAVLVMAFGVSECANVSAFEAPRLAASLSPLDTIAKDPTRFEAPLEFASLKEIHRGSNDTFIIHVQDAHANFSGQQNLASALDEIMRKYSVSLVLVEGGTRDDSLTPFKDVAPADVWKKVAKKYLVQGQITGEEYLNLTSDHPMKILGIEDKPLYMKSLETYASIAALRDETLSYLARLREAVNKIKRKRYPEPLLAYEKMSGGFLGDAGFQSSFETLLKLSGSRSLSEFPNLEKLRDLTDPEKRIDFRLANLEQAALLSEIDSKGGGGELERYLKRENLASASKASQLAYFQNTFYIAKQRNISLSRYPNLAAYLEYLKNFSEIDLDAVLAEMRRFEESVYEKLLQGRDQSLTRAADRFTTLLDTAYRIRMTADDFELYRANNPTMPIQPLLGLLNRELAEEGYFRDFVGYENRLEKGNEALEAFYRSVNERDHAFVRNTERLLKQENQKVAILISGGYHTGHLKQLFREKGYSYAVLAPVVTSETNQEKYEKILLEPIRKETKTVETVTGNSRKSGSLSALEDDLLRLKDKSGVRQEMLMESPRLAEMLKDLSAESGVNPELLAEQVLKTQTRAVSEPTRSVPQAAARLAEERPSDWLQEVSGYISGFLSQEEAEHAGRVARRLRSWGLSEEAQASAWMLSVPMKDLQRVFSHIRNERVSEISRRADSILGIVYEPMMDGKTIKGIYTIDRQTKMIVKASEGDREAMILVWAEKLESMMEWQTIKGHEAYVREVKHVFVPLANRLGREEDTGPLLRDEVARLETPESFKVAEEEVVGITAMSKEERQVYLASKRAQVIEYLAANGLQRTDFRTIRTRIKSTSSSMLKLDADERSARPRELTDVFGLMLVPRDDERIYEVVTLIQNMPGFSVDSHRGGGLGTVQYNIASHGFEGYQVYLFDETGRPLSVFIMTAPNYELYYTGEKAHSQYAMQKEAELKNQVFASNFNLTGNFEEDLITADRQLAGKIFVTVANEVKKGRIEYVPIELPEEAAPADAAAFLGVDRLQENYPGVFNAEAVRQSDGSVTLGQKRMEWSESKPLVSGMVFYLPSTASQRKGTPSPKTFRGRLILSKWNSADVRDGWERLRSDYGWLRDRGAFDRFATEVARELGLLDSQELYAALAKNIVSKEQIFSVAVERGVTYLSQLWKQPVESRNYSVRLEMLLGALARVRLPDVSSFFAAVGSHQFSEPELRDMYSRMITGKKMSASLEGAIENEEAQIRVAGSYDRPGVLLAIAKAIRDSQMNIRSLKSEGVVVRVTVRQADPEKVNELLKILQDIPDVRMPEVGWLAKARGIATTTIELTAQDEVGRLYDILQSLWALDPRINVKHIETESKSGGQVAVTLILEHPVELKSSRIGETVDRATLNKNGPAGARLAKPAGSIADLVGGEKNLRYLERIRDIVNPNGEPRTVLQPAFGADISTLLALTDASRIVAVDLIDFDPDKTLIDSSLLEAYGQSKAEKGYAAGPILRQGRNLYPFMMYELRRLGVDAEHVEVARLSDNPLVYSMTFPWEGKMREIIIASGQDATNFDYAGLFTLLGIQKIDAYALKAGEYYVDWGEERFDETTRLISETYLAEGGYLVLDQPVRVATYTGRFERVPIANPDGVLFGYESKRKGLSKFIGSGRDIGASVYRKLESRSSLLSGADVVAILAERGVPPGPRVGEILRHVTDEERQGLIKSRPQALQRAEELAGADGARLAETASDNENVSIFDQLYLSALSFHAKWYRLQSQVYMATAFLAVLSVLTQRPGALLLIAVAAIPYLWFTAYTAWRNSVFQAVFRPTANVWERGARYLGPRGIKSLHGEWRRLRILVSALADYDAAAGNRTTPSMLFNKSLDAAMTSIFDMHRTAYTDEEKIQFIELAEKLFFTYEIRPAITWEGFHRSMRRDDASTPVLRASFKAIRNIYFSGRFPLTVEHVSDLGHLIQMVQQKIPILRARIHSLPAGPDKDVAQLALGEAQSLISAYRQLGWSAFPQSVIHWKSGTDAVAPETLVSGSLLIRYDSAADHPDLAALTTHLRDSLNVEVVKNLPDSLEIHFLTKGVPIQELRLTTSDKDLGRVYLGFGKPKEDDDRIEGRRLDLRAWFGNDLIPWLAGRNFSEIQVEILDRAGANFFSDIGFVPAGNGKMNYRIFKTAEDYLEQGLPEPLPRIQDTDPLRGEVVFMRHGQSQDSDTVEGSEGGRFTGHRDVPLTPAGQANARWAGDAFHGLFPDYRFDEAYTSNLKRASESASLFLQGESSIGVPLYQHEALKERHYGALQGENRTALIGVIAEKISVLGIDVTDIASAAKELSARWYETPLRTGGLTAASTLAPQARAILNYWRRQYEAVPPRDVFGGAESLKNVEARVVPFFREEIHARAVRGKRIFVSSHSNALRAIAKDLFGLSPEEIGSFTLPLATPIRVRFNRNGSVHSVIIVEPFTGSPDPKNLSDFQNALSAKGIPYEVKKSGESESRGARIATDRGDPDAPGVNLTGARLADGSAAAGNDVWISQNWPELSADTVRSWSREGLPLMAGEMLELDSNVAKKLVQQLSQKPLSDYNLSLSDTLLLYSQAKILRVASIYSDANSSLYYVGIPLASEWDNGKWGSYLYLLVFGNPGIGGQVLAHGKNFIDTDKRHANFSLNFSGDISQQEKLLSLKLNARLLYQTFGAVRFDYVQKNKSLPFEGDVYHLWSLLNTQPKKVKEEILRMGKEKEGILFSWVINDTDFVFYDLGQGSENMRYASNISSWINQSLITSGKPPLGRNDEETLSLMLENEFQHVIAPPAKGGKVMILALESAEGDRWIYIVDTGEGMPIHKVFKGDFQAATGGGRRAIRRMQELTSQWSLVSRGAEWDQEIQEMVLPAFPASAGVLFKLKLTDPSESDISLGARLAGRQARPTIGEFESLDRRYWPVEVRTAITGIWGRLESKQLTVDQILEHYRWLIIQASDAGQAKRLNDFLIRLKPESRQPLAKREPAVERALEELYPGTEIEWLDNRQGIRWQTEVLKRYLYWLVFDIQRQGPVSLSLLPSEPMAQWTRFWPALLRRAFERISPEKRLAAFILWNKLLGRTVVVASDLRDTLSSLSEDQVAFPGVVEAIQKHLDTGQPFYIISSDPTEVIEKFLLAAGFLSVTSDFKIVPAKPGAERLVWLARTGMDITYFKDGRLERGNLFPGLTDVQAEKVAHILNQVTEDENLKSIFSPQNGYESSEGYEPGDFEMRVSPKSADASMVWLPAGRLQGQSKKNFSQSYSDELKRWVGHINSMMRLDPKLDQFGALVTGKSTIEVIPLKANKGDALAAIRQLFYPGKKVRFVFFGDNIPDGNDSPAMREASVGVQVGANQPLAFEPGLGRTVLYAGEAADGSTAKFLNVVDNPLQALRSGARLALPESESGMHEREKIRNLIGQAHGDLRKLEKLLQHAYPKAFVDINEDEGYLYANRSQLGDAGEVFYGEILDYLKTLPEFQLRGFHVLDHNFTVLQDGEYSDLMQENIINEGIAENLVQADGKPKLYEELSEEEKERYILEPLVRELRSSDDTFLHIDHHYPLHVLASTSTAVLLVDLIRYIQKIHDPHLMLRLRDTFGILDHADADIILSHFLLTHPYLAVNEATAKMIRKTADFNEYLRKTDTPENKARVKLLYNIVSAFESEVERGRMSVSQVMKELRGEDKLPTRPRSDKVKPVGIIGFVENFDVKPYLEKDGEPVDFESTFLTAASIESHPLHAQIAAIPEKRWIASFAAGVIEYVKDRVAIERKLEEALDSNGFFKEADGRVPPGTLRKSGPTLFAYLEAGDRSFGSVSIIRYFMDNPELRSLDDIRAIVVTFVRDGKRFFRIRVLDKPDKSFLVLDEPGGVYETLNLENPQYQADGKAKAGGIGGKGGLTDTSEAQTQELIRDIDRAVRQAVAKQFPGEVEGARLAGELPSTNGHSGSLLGLVRQGRFMAMKVDVVLDSEGKQQLLIYDAKESELLLGLHVERQGNNGAVTIGGITNWGFLENKSKTPRERMYYRQTQILLRHIVLARLRARGYSSVLVRASGKEKDLFRSLGFKQPSGSNAGSLEKTLIAKPPFSGARLAIEKIKQAALPTAEEIDLLYTGFTSDGTKRIDSAHVMTLGYVSRDHVVRVFLADFIDREAKGKKIDILSIGPGHGDFEALLNSRGHRVLAVDASRENVLYTSQKGVETRLADAHALPDLGRKFDLVLMSESVGHLRIMEAFRQAKEQLKPGGKLIVTTYFGSSMEESRLNLEKIRYFDYEPQDIHSAITLSGLWNRSAHRMVVEPRNPKRGIEEDRGLLIYTAVKPSGFKMFFRRAHGARLAHGERGFVNFGLYPNRSLFFGEPGDLENSFIMRLRSIDDEAETAEISIHRASTHEELTRATLTLYTQNDFEYGEHEIWITPELFYDGLLLAINKPRGKIFVDTWAHVKYRVRKGNVLLEGARLAKNVSRHQSPMFKVRPNDVLAISVKLDDKAVRRLLKAEWQDAQAIHMTVRSYENPMDILSWITPGLGKKEILTVNGAQFTISVTSISGDYSRITVEKPYGTFVRRHDRSAARLAKNPVESSQPAAARLADSNHFVGEHSLRTTRADVATSLTRDKKLYLEAIKARIAEHENFPIEAQDGIVNFAREGNVIYFLGENGERLRDGAGRLLQFAPSDEDLRAVSGNVEIDRSLSIAPLEKQEITVSELVSDADRAADGVVAAAEPFAAELSQIAQTFVFDLDTLPADAAQRPAYIQHLLRVLAAIRAKSVAQNVYFRFKSTQNNLEEIYGNPLAAGLGESLVREPVRGVREVHLTLPGHFAADQANIPVEAFEAGRELHLMAFVLFSIVTGKWSAIEGNKGKAVPEAFVDVYRTFLGEKAKDASTQEIAGALHAFLNGQTGPNILSLAMKFALPKLRPVGWSRMLQAFKNIERMVGQAA